MMLPDPDASWAYLIGVSEFAGRPDLATLPQVPNNLADLREALTSERGGFLPAHCRIAEDPADMGVIAEDLTRLAKLATDTMFVYYAGHGCLDADGKLHLTFPASTPHGFGFNMLEIAVLRRLLARSTARRRILVLDCCYSGRAIDLMSDLDSQVISELPDIAGGFTMTSAPRTDAAKAVEGERYTEFTGELIGVLRDGVGDGPELLSLDTVFDAVWRRLRGRGMPEPKCARTDAAGGLALARNASWVPKPAPPVVLPQRLTVAEASVAGGAVEMAAMFAGLLGPGRRKQAVNSQAGIVLTDDPRQVAELMTSPHPGVETGLRLMQSLVGRVDRRSGDGAVTAVLVAAALLQDLSALDGSADAVRNVAGEVIDALERESRPCRHEDVMPVLATVSKHDEIRRLEPPLNITDWRDVDFVRDAADSLRTSWTLSLDARLVWPDRRAIANPLKSPRIFLYAVPIVDATPLVELARSRGPDPIVVFTPSLDPPAVKMLRLNTPQGRLAVVQFGAALSEGRLTEVYRDLAVATGGQQAGTLGSASEIEFGPLSVGLVMPDSDGVRCRARRALLREQVRDEAWLAQRLALLENKLATVALDDQAAVAALRRASRVGDEGLPRVVLGGGAALSNAADAITAEGAVAKAWAHALRVPAERLPESGHRLLDPLPVVRGIVEAVRDVAVEYLES